MIFLIAVVYSYNASKGLIISAARTIAKNLTFSTIYELEIVFQGIEKAITQWLRNKVSSIKIYESGYACLVSRKGVFITHRRDEFIMRESILSLAEAKGDDELVEIARKMIGGEEGFAPLRLIATDRKAWMYYAPLPSSGWSLAVVFPDDELFADTHRLIKQIICIAAAGLPLADDVTVLAVLFKKPFSGTAQLSPQNG